MHKNYISVNKEKKKDLINVIIIMRTLRQIICGKRLFKNPKNKRPHLINCPQKKATCLRVFQMTPRKPNSALRKVAWVMLSNGYRINAYIPGIGHTLQKHSVVLVRGGRVKDLPGMKYTIIRGKFDLKRIAARRQGRSKYGAKKILHRVDHRYRKLRY
jgi:small subunit ribosomal protein S12